MKRLLMSGLFCICLPTFFAEEQALTCDGQLELSTDKFLCYRHDIGDLDPVSFLPDIKTRLFYGADSNFQEFLVEDGFLVEDVQLIQHENNSYLLVLLRDQSRMRYLLPRLFVLNQAPQLLEFPFLEKEDFFPLTEGDLSWRQNKEGLFFTLQKALIYHVSTPPYVFEQREFAVLNEVLETGSSFTVANTWSQQINLAAHYMQLGQYAKAAELYEKGLQSLRQEQTESSKILIQEVQDNLSMCQEKIKSQ